MMEPRSLCCETLPASDTAPADGTEWFAHAGLRGARPERLQHFASSLLPAQAAMHGPPPCAVGCCTRWDKGSHPIGLRLSRQDPASGRLGDAALGYLA